MDLTQLLILQLIAHVLADFTFQPDAKARDKNQFGFKSKFLKWHILFTFVLSWILSFQFYFVFAALSIAIIHFIIDGFKMHFNNHKVLSKYTFFIDQTLHLLFIAVIVCAYNQLFGIKLSVNILINSTYLAIFSAFLLSIKPANVLIREVFNLFEIKVNNQSDLPNAGKLIGILERWLVLAFIFLNQFEAVGFLIAAKSILRYKDDDTIKTEYVLIGTMLSFGIAIALGIIVKSV